jgi:hypothetical protein
MSSHTSTVSMPLRTRSFGGSAFFVVVAVIFAEFDAVVTVVLEVLVTEVVTEATAGVCDEVFLPPQPHRRITAAVSGRIYLNFMCFLSV